MMMKRSSHMPTLTKQRQDEEQRDVVAHAAEPEQLNHARVDRDERPVEDRVRPGHAVQHHVPLVRVGAVPGEERLVGVAVGHDHPGDQHDLRHVVDVPHGDEVFQAVELAQRNRPASSPSRSRSRWRRRRSRAGRSWRASRAAPTPRSRSSPPSAPRAPAASRCRPAAGRPSRSAASAAPTRASRAPACRRSACAAIDCARSRSVARSGTRPVNQNSATRCRRSTPRTRPRSAGCGTAATGPSCSGYGNSQ